MANKTEKNQIEIYTEWYLQDLQGHGFIKEYTYEPRRFKVSSTATYGRLKRYKTKPSTVQEFNLFPEIHYTPDYELIWDASAEYLFYEVVDQTGCFQFGKPPFVAHMEDRDGQQVIVSYIDVKPTNAVARRGGRVSSSKSFTYKSRMLWDSRRIYINKCVPIPMSGTGHAIALFTTTFVPGRYLWTDKATQLRKINFRATDIKGFVMRRSKEIKAAIENTFALSDGKTKKQDRTGKGTSQKNQTDETLFSDEGGS